GGDSESGSTSSPASSSAHVVDESSWYSFSLSYSSTRFQAALNTFSQSPQRTRPALTARISSVTENTVRHLGHWVNIVGDLVIRRPATTARHAHARRTRDPDRRALPGRAGGRVYPTAAGVLAARARGSA